MNREERLNAIRQNPQIDVLIVGAGINGIGTFRDLALQGLNVLLIDRADFCSGASAASSHMAHGGIRYLENGEFRLVREAVQERNRLVQNAPHYVKPLPTTIPIFRWFSGLFNAPLKFAGLLDRPSERGVVVIKAGLTMYDAYTGAQRTVPRHEVNGRAESLRRFPKLNPDVAFTATYYDALMESPERICVEILGDAETNHAMARAVNYVSVAAAAGDSVRLIDELSGETLDVKPQIVVNAAGPWIDFANQAMGQQTRYIGGTKGSHLVLDHPELRQAIGDSEFFFENVDGRIVLICPLMDRVLVGTSDIRIDDPDDAVCTQEEIDYFIEMVDIVFPSIEVDRSQIVFTFSGVRPLPYGDANSTGQISRDHSTEVIEPEGIDFPIYNLIGGKWTTFRAFAESVTDKVLQRLGHPRQQSTKELAVGGGNAYPSTESEQRRWVEQLASETSLDPGQLHLLFGRYGTRAETIAHWISKRKDAPHAASTDARLDQPLDSDSTYLRGEIAFLAAEEQVTHLDDLVLRRTSLAMLGKLTQKMTEELAEIVGVELGWSADTQQEEIERLIALLRKKHRIELSSDDAPKLHAAPVAQSTHPK